MRLLRLQGVKIMLPEVTQLVRDRAGIWMEAFSSRPKHTSPADSTAELYKSS